MVESTAGGAMVEKGPTTPGGATDGDWAAGGGDPGGAEQMESQGESEDPEGLGGAEGSVDWGGGGDPEDHGGAGETEDEVKWSDEAADGRRLTKAEPLDEGARWS